LRKLLSGFFPSWLNQQDNKRIFEGTFHSFIIQGVSVPLVFAGNLLLARWAGPDGYGRYVHIFNWISLLGVAAVGGREDLMLSEITQYSRNKEPGLILLVIRRANRHILIASAVLSAAFLLLIYILPIKTLHEYREEFLFGAGAIYCTAFLILNQSILQALHYIRLSQYVERLIKPLLLIFFFATARVLVYSLDSTLLVILAESVLFICCCILGRVVFLKLQGFKYSGEKIHDKDRLTKKTFYFFTITMLTMVAAKLVMLVFPWFLPEKDVGIFNVCFRISDLIVYPFFLMHSILPQLFAYHTDTGIEYKQNLYTYSTRLMLFISVPLLLLNILAGRLFLGWFGKEFTVGYPVLVLLSLMQFLFSLFGPANTILMMQNREKDAAIALVGYVLALLAGSILLIPVLGMTGGGLAMLIGCLIYNIILASMTYRHCGVISPFLIFVKRFFP
jgi:O-antigen/teichoic acid export membrane protein